MEQHQIKYSYENGYSYDTVKDFVKRFYFELVYSEDSDDPNTVIWTDNGNLKNFTQVFDNNTRYFIGSNAYIPYAKDSLLTDMFTLNSRFKLTDKLFYQGYASYISAGGTAQNSPYYFDFDFAGGNTETLFTCDDDFQELSNSIYDYFDEEYNNGVLLTDDEGYYYIQGNDYSTSTFNPRSSL